MIFQPGGYGVTPSSSENTDLSQLSSTRDASVKPTAAADGEEQGQGPEQVGALGVGANDVRLGVRVAAGWQQRPVRYQAGLKYSTPVRSATRSSAP